MEESVDLSPSLPCFRRLLLHPSSCSRFCQDQFPFASFRLADRAFVKFRFLPDWHLIGVVSSMSCESGGTSVERSSSLTMGMDGTPFFQVFLRKLTVDCSYLIQ